MCVCDIRITDNSPQSAIYNFVSDEKAAIQREKDLARMAEVFLELDDDADGLWVPAPSRITDNERILAVIWSISGTNQ